MRQPEALVPAVLAALATIVVVTLLISKKKSGRGKRPTTGGKVVGEVSALYVYPIKSCAGIKVTSSDVEARGFLFDRLWLVVDSAGNFCTQRTLPAMSQIKPHLPPSFDDPLVVDAPGMPTLEVPVVRKGSSKKVRVWNEFLQAVDQGDAAAKWFETYLGKEGVRLVRFPEGFKRQVDERYAPKGQVTGYADGFPFLLISEGSLEELNARLDQPIPINRFRPNIVVSGVAPFSEDQWDEISVGSLPMQMAKPCSRCKIPNIDIDTSNLGVEPGKTLRGYRTGKLLQFKNRWEKWDNEIFFGVNVIHHEHSGRISEGDKVTVYTSK